MNDLEDLEICRRIAEIDGANVTLILKSDVECETWLYNGLTGDEYNPLTNDALCFQLMVKYDVDLTSPYRIDGETEWEAQLLREGADYFVRVYNENPNKAICLAIIEMHEED